MSHLTKYRFYIQKYPQENKSFPREDVELKFDCDYMQATGLAFDGDIKNTYEEDYAEMNGKRLHIPPPQNLRHNTTEVKMKFLFTKGDVQSRLQKLIEYCQGQKIEWHDTFRGGYATLLMTKAPSIEGENLYGESPYMVVEFTFTNIWGKTFTESQI